MLSSNMLLLNLILLIDVTFSTPTSVTTTLAFGTTPQGTATRYQTVILSNTGKFAALNLASISVGATVNYQQANSCPVGATLAPLANCSITVAFTPQGLGALGGTLTVTDDSLNVANSTQTTKLSGTSSPGGPALSLSVTSLTFGRVTQATPPNSSPQNTVTVTNKGTVNMNISISSSNGNFTVVAATTNACGNGFNVTLTPGANCNAAVTFTPPFQGVAATGDRDGILFITNNSGVAGTYQGEVALKGTATGIPLASLCVKGTNCTKTLTFPGVIQSNPPNSSPIQTVTLKNVGNVPLTLQNRFIGFTNDFLVANLATNNCTAGQVLAPNSNCDIGVTFNPSLTRITGPRSDLLRVFTNSNDIGNSEIDIALEGIALGTPIASLSVTTFTFPNTAFGNTSARKTAVLTNTGNNPLIIQAFQLQNSNDFQLPAPLSNACPLGGAGLSPATSCNIDITFAPNGTTAGLRTDVLDVIDFNNNVVSSIQQISVSGVATGGTTTLSLAVSPLTGLNFGNQTINTISGPQTVTVTNNNTVNMNIGVGATTAEFSVGGTCAGAIIPAASCTVFVEFAPNFLGTRNDVLFISVNISGANAREAIPLAGVGVGSVSLGTSPTNLAFPDTQQGGVSASQSVVIRNNGTAPVAISNIFTAFGTFNIGGNLDYQQLNTCNINIRLVPGASCTVNVFFTPLATGSIGARTGNLVIVENVNNNIVRQVVPLTGNAIGTPNLVLSPAGLTFLDQATPFGAGVVQQFNLSNTGTAPVTITTWGSTGDFNISNIFSTCGNPIPAGASCNAFVSFNPNTAGLRQAHLFVLSNSNNTNSFQSMTLTCFGTP